MTTHRPDTQPARTARPDSGGFLRADPKFWLTVILVLAGAVSSWATARTQAMADQKANDQVHATQGSQLQDHEARLRALEKLTTESVTNQTTLIQAVQRIDHKLDREP